LVKILHQPHNTICMSKILQGEIFKPAEMGAAVDPISTDRRRKVRLKRDTLKPAFADVRLSNGDVFDVETIALPNTALSYAARVAERMAGDTARLAEYGWRVRESIIRETEDKTEKEVVALAESDRRFAERLALYRTLCARASDDLKQGFTRHHSEEKELNGTYKEYRALAKELESKQRELNAVFVKLFKTKGEADFLDLADRDLLESETSGIEKKINDFKQENPDVGARIAYDTIRDYARQLRENGFIWTKSRQKLFYDIMTGALTSRPIAMLMGETGTGKTGLAFALASEVSGHDAERSVGGEKDAFSRLLGHLRSDKDGQYYEYGPLLRAMTGKRNSRETTPSSTPGVFFDDEFNTRPTSVQREILKFVAGLRPGRKVAIPGTTLVEEIRSGFLYLAAGNPPGERYEREETGIETAREFAGNVINVGYLEQTTDNPELYHIILAALLDADTGRLTAVTEAETAPDWTLDRATGEYALNIDPAAGGFLWRFANLWNELNRAFSGQETALTRLNPANKEDFHLQKFILDPGVVITWLDSYKRDLSAMQNKHIGWYMVEKLQAYIAANCAEEDRVVVLSYLQYFNIALYEPDEMYDNKSPFRSMTPKEVGYLDPSVPRNKETTEAPPPKFEVYDLFNQDGKELHYVKKSAVGFAPGTRFSPKPDAPASASLENTTLMGLLYDAESQSTKEGIAVLQDDSGKVRTTSVIDIPQLYELLIPEHGKPFEYDKAKAKEYGMEQLDIKGHTKAQELVNALSCQDPGFSKVEQRPDPKDNKKTIDVTVVDLEKVKRFWVAHCGDLPDIPKKSPWYFEALWNKQIVSTINNNEASVLGVFAPPRFGESGFLLVMDWPEFDCDNPADREKAHQHPSVKLLKELMSNDTLTDISRDDLNAALWQDHDARVQSVKAKEIVAKLLGVKANDPSIEQYELRLLRYDEYARSANDKGYGEKNLWTWFDDYYQRDVGHRSGLIGGNTDNGGAAFVYYYPRDSADVRIAVRLVLSRKSQK